MSVEIEVTFKFTETVAGDLNKMRQDYRDNPAMVLDALTTDAIKQLKVMLDEECHD
jgi:hypothetical protein